MYIKHVCEKSPSNTQNLLHNMHDRRYPAASEKPQMHDFYLLQTLFASKNADNYPKGINREIPSYFSASFLKAPMLLA